MIDGFPRLVNQLIERRLDDIFTSEEFGMLLDGIYQELEQQLESSIKHLDGEEKINLIDDLRNNIFQQVYYQNKLIYRTAFKDAISLCIDTLIKSEK